MYSLCLVHRLRGLPPLRPAARGLLRRPRVGAHTDRDAAAWGASASRSAWRGPGWAGRPRACACSSWSRSASPRRTCGWRPACPPPTSKWRRRELGRGGLRGRPTSSRISATPGWGRTPCTRSLTRTAAAPSSCLLFPSLTADLTKSTLTPLLCARKAPRREQTGATPHTKNRPPLARRRMPARRPRCCRRRRRHHLLRPCAGLLLRSPSALTAQQTGARQRRRRDHGSRLLRARPLPPLPQSRSPGKLRRNRPRRRRPRPGEMQAGRPRGRGRRPRRDGRRRRRRARCSHSWRTARCGSTPTRTRRSPSWCWRATATEC